MAYNYLNAHLRQAQHLGRKTMSVLLYENFTQGMYFIELWQRYWHEYGLPRSQLI